MSEKKFPNYGSHREARCFQCDRTMLPADASNSGHAGGHGEFCGYCRVCNIATWYDVAKGATKLEDIVARDRAVALDGGES